MESTVFQFIGDAVGNATGAFVTPAAERVIQLMRSFALAAVTIYIVLMGISIAFGMVQAPAVRMIVQALKITLITGIALTVDVYGSFVVAGFESMEAGLVDAMGQSGGSIFGLLDSTLGKGVDLMNICIQRADDAGWSFGSILAWWVAAVVTGFGTAVVALMGGAAIVVAKFALAIMFALGPFFILLLLFPVTARFFDAWFSQVINYTLLVVIIAVIMAFAMAAFNAFIDGADMNGDGEINPLLVSLEIFVLSAFLVFIINQAYGMSAGLAGGLSMGALTLAHLAAPGRAARNIADPVSTRRDLQSGMMTTARRSNHVTAGNTVFNPAYSQQIAKQIGRNWGRPTGGSVKKGKSE